jgi:radical SAM superfamily enzyme
MDISTRPDCVEDHKLDLIQSYSDKADIIVEYGLQSINRQTLIDLNRGHTFAEFVDAVERTKARGLETLAHIIIDLPGY